jgi:hypothetical protein
MMSRPYRELRFQVQAAHWQEARAIPFREVNQVLMQDVGGMENMELSSAT